MRAGCAHLFTKTVVVIICHNFSVNFVYVVEMYILTERGCLELVSLYQPKQPKVTGCTQSLGLCVQFSFPKPNLLNRFYTP